MKLFMCIALILPAILAIDDCYQTENCNVEKGCVCMSGKSPLKATETPQFVLLTFDDAVTRHIYDTYLEPLLIGRKNPDTNPISATFFVPHEYTDYESVNALYNKGFEIGVHSISKSGAEYWQNSDIKVLVDEFSGQKDIISKFANIDKTDIQGVRVPFLQIAGNKTFEAYKTAGLSYDSSWTTRSNMKLFPYTLDYVSTQICSVLECPTLTIPQFFVSPINNLVGKDNIECNALYGCMMNKTADGIKDWLIAELDKTYKSERTPFKLLVNSVWLSQENNYNGFKLFLDYLKEKKEIFIVSESEAIKWMKEPVALPSYKTTVKSRNRSCTPITCALDKGTEEIRYMRSCVSCPKVYPWVGNPQGKLFI